MYKNVQLTDQELSLLVRFIEEQRENFDPNEALNLHILLRAFNRQIDNQEETE